jgi:hypothetical protein
MKNANRIEIIDTNYNLNADQIKIHKNKLQQLKNKSGILSLCLDEKSLFVEFSENLISLASIIDLLSDINFPVKEQLVEFEKQMIIH